MGIASTSRPILVRGPFRENRQDVLGLSGPDDTAPTSPVLPRRQFRAPRLVREPEKKKSITYN